MQRHIPCRRCLPAGSRFYFLPHLLGSLTVFYSEPFQYHPVHALVLRMHSTHGELTICLDSVLTCFFGDKNKKATGLVVVPARNTKKERHLFVVDSVL